ncbi:MAG: GNAT family N-acetyltransferase [Candidatus Thalassarchaeaceae archaeon]|nr:GNAT family N-acetyltransferase [Candidatus Thalassarchaeaceae archaeon]
MSAGAGVALLAGWQTERMVACPTLETDRLILRPFRDDDLADQFAMMDSPEVRAALRIPDGAGLPEAFNAMASVLGQWELRGTGHWALEEKDSGQFVGSAGLNRPERHNWPGVEVGWRLHPESWGRGYATEAGAAAVRYGFEELGEERLFSCIVPDNHRSQAVARRLGFELIEERVISFFPEDPEVHGIWALDRDTADFSR